MVVNLSIKGVPESVAVGLRLRAERNHRSLQGELMAIVERAAAEAGWPGPTGQPEGATKSPRSGSVVRHGTKTIEQIAAEHRARFPKPIAKLPRSVDIIRDMRDSR